MTNGKLAAPNLDDRNWQQLKEAAIALIPKHTREWTDHNPSDPGIVLIELFAWLMDQTIYRLNRVPEKNFVEFLNLIGVTRHPPTPAQTDITFKFSGKAIVAIPRGTQVSTKPTGTADGLIYETDEPLNAINLKMVLWRELDDPEKPSYVDHTPIFVKEPFGHLELTILPGKTQSLILGVEKQTLLPLTLTFRSTSEAASITTKWRYSGPLKPDKLWPEIDKVSKPSYNFSKPAKVVIEIPNSWQQEAMLIREDAETGKKEFTEALYWIAIELSNNGGSEAKIDFARIAANIISASDVVTVREELLGQSNGKPYQIFQLKNTPLHQINSIPDGLVIAVKESDAWKDWARVDDFSNGTGEHYMCNPVTGEISLGNYDPSAPAPTGKNSPSEEDNENRDQKRFFGKVPPEGSQIKAVSYRYVAGGSNGNIGAGTIDVQRKAIVGEDGTIVSAVINELPATGGSDWEAIADTKRRGPQAVRNQNRAVTVEDYELLARAATTDVAKVRCFPPKAIELNEREENGRKVLDFEWEKEPFERIPGRVNMIIVPNNRDRQPTPSPELLREVKQFVDGKRAIAGIFVAWPPYYVEVKIQTTVFIKHGGTRALVEQDIREELYKFLHPLTGGPEGKGWEIGQDLYLPDLFKKIQAVPQVSYIAELKIANVDGVRLAIKDYQLICAAEKNNENFKITVEEEALEI